METNTSYIREVKLICLPSDSMGDRGHIKVIIYIYYDIYIYTRLISDTIAL